MTRAGIIIVMNIFPHSVRLFIYRHLAAVGIILAATFAIQPVRPFLAIQIIVLIYLLPIMISTVLWGLTPGVLASLLAFLAFNYYFIEPYHTFQVHSTQDLITLIIFLIVAVVMSQLIGQAREGIRLAHSREWEATRMYELISALAGLQDARSIAEILASHTFETFGCLRVETVIKAEKNRGERVVVYPDESGSHALRGNLPRRSASSQPWTGRGASGGRSHAERGNELRGATTRDCPYRRNKTSPTFASRMVSRTLPPKPTACLNATTCPPASNCGSPISLIRKEIWLKGRLRPVALKEPPVW